MGFSSSGDDTYSARSKGFHFPIPFRRFSLSGQPSPIVLNRRCSLSYTNCPSLAKEFVLHYWSFYKHTFGGI